MLSKKALGVGVVATALVALAAAPAMANHKLGKLHWAAETAQTTVDLTIDDHLVDGSWRPSTVESNWDQSSQISFNHRGAVEITAASSNLGNNGFLGAAFISYTNGTGHITDVDIQLNEFYPLTNDQKQSVFCQELGHGLGLAHLHARRYDPSTSCMSDSFALTPNAHDFAQLDLIYNHDDGFNSFAASATRGRAKYVIPAR